MLKEFKEFAMRGNVLDMAVGIIIGAAFGSIVTSLVNDLLMPPIGMLLGGADFSNLFFVLKEGATHRARTPRSPWRRQAGAVTLNIGVFLNAVISFLLVAFAVFLLVRGVNRMRREEPPPPAPPTTQEALLGEIRDLLRKRSVV